MVGPRQQNYRASCEKIELRLRVSPEGSWIVIKRPGGETKYIDLPDDQVQAVTAFFPEKHDPPEKFRKYVTAIETQFGAS